MAQCVGQSVVSGVTVLTPVADSPCTSAVLLTPAEYGAISANPFNLSGEDGTLYAAAIVGVWVVGWAVKALILTLKNDGEALD